MWSNWIETGKSIAERAKEAAEGIEAQLNDSVGITGNSSNISNSNQNIDEVKNNFDDIDDHLRVEDDSFYDDNVDFTVPTKSNVSFQTTNPKNIKNDEYENNLSALENVKEEEEEDEIEIEIEIEEDDDEEEEEEVGWNLADDDIVFDDNENYNEQDEIGNNDNGESNKNSTKFPSILHDDKELNTQESNELLHDASEHNNYENNQNDPNDNELGAEKDNNQLQSDTSMVYIDKEKEVVNHDNIKMVESSVTETETIDSNDENDGQANSSVDLRESSNEDSAQQNQAGAEQIKETAVDIDTNSIVSCENESKSTTELSEQRNQFVADISSENPQPTDDNQPDINSTEIDLDVVYSSNNYKDISTAETDAVIVSDKDTDMCSNAEMRNHRNDENSNEVFDQNSKRTIDDQNKKITDLEYQIKSLMNTLQAREQQLEANSAKIATLQNLHESEKLSLLIVVKETKEEAKKRMLKAKERAEEMQNRLKTVTRDLDRERQKQKAINDSNVDKDVIIEELRKEGESLAQKQGTLTENFRKAQKESKELRSQVNDLMEKVQKHENTITSQKQERGNLEKEIQNLEKYKEQIVTLSDDLNAAKEESEQLKILKFSLEDKIKELKKECSNYLKESSEQKAQTSEKLQSYEKNIQREKDEFMLDMENKLATVEKESNMREDTLTRELEDVRKRWQEAVQRAEVLSMDVQQSTAPLIRQLESAERTYRIRASAWTELEQKLRSDLEDSVIENESLFKEITELKTANNKNERQLKSKETHLESISNERNDLSVQVLELEKKLRASKADGEKFKHKCDEMERLSQESATKARNEMMETILKNDSLYKEEVDELKRKLTNVEEENTKLKEEIEDALKSSSTMIEETQFKKHANNAVGIVANQASILESTLLGLDNDIDEYSDDGNFDNGDITNLKSSTNTSSSFVAIEKLTQAVRASKLELNALRKQLAISEETRIALQEQLASAKIAAEKLPIFEERVEQLTVDLHEKQLDLEEMRENMKEVKEMYRSQLDNLLEEKVANIQSTEYVSEEY